MRNELIEYLSALAVADPKQTRIVEAVYFTSKGGYNSMRFLENMFHELGVLWYEPPEGVTPYWKKHYGSDRPNMYTRPREYSHASHSGKTRLQICREAFEFLDKETKPHSEERLPVGVEQAILRLLDLAKAQSHEEEGLAALNKELLKDRIRLIKSRSGNYKFEYGILTDPDEPLFLEADDKLKKLEKGLRELIHQVLSDVYPKGWDVRLGLDEDHLNEIRQRMEDGRKRGDPPPENSLLDFSEFNDLITIIRNCWQFLQPWLEDKNENISFLKILRPFRNALAHHRLVSREDLMLVIGIASRLYRKVERGLMSIHRDKHGSGK